MAPPTVHQSGKRGPSAVASALSPVPVKGIDVTDRAVAIVSLSGAPVVVSAKTSVRGGSQAPVGVQSVCVAYSSAAYQTTTSVGCPEVTVSGPPPHVTDIDVVSTKASCVLAMYAGYRPASSAP